MKSALGFSLENLRRGQVSGSTTYTLAISLAYPPAGIKTPGGHLCYPVGTFGTLAGICDLAGTGMRIFVIFLPGCIHIFLQ